MSKLTQGNNKNAILLKKSDVIFHYGMKNLKKIFFIILPSVIFLPFTFVSADQLSGGGVGIKNPLKNGTNDLYALISLVLNNVVLPIGGVIVVFFLIYSGFLMVTSGGNEEKLKVAKKTVLYTIVGAVILLGSWVIAKAVENTIKQIAPFQTNNDQVRFVVRDAKNL